ncbi:MAG: hypothetical protein RL348_622 [Bacteroidota bacterium]|jgi:glycosyltransferase involved in cell wall biosynthesis
MRFSIIVPHYDASIKDDIFRRGIKSLLDQTNQDFEVLIYHDGPLNNPPMPDIWKEFGNRCKLEITSKRKNDWGHSNRDKGIREAKGEYIVHFNPDNVLYSFALEEIEKEINKEYNKIYTKNDIIIFPVLMMGMQSNGKFIWRDVENADKNYMIMTGHPPIKYNIDAMQLVMKKELWFKYGGWYDKSKESDGNMYTKFCFENDVRYCSKILGEHW